MIANELQALIELIGLDNIKSVGFALAVVYAIGFLLFIIVFIVALKFILKTHRRMKHYD